jgi:hypothetical protein
MDSHAIAQWAHDIRNTLGTVALYLEAADRESAQAATRGVIRGDHHGWARSERPTAGWHDHRPIPEFTSAEIAIEFDFHLDRSSISHRNVKQCLRPCEPGVISMRSRGTYPNIGSSMRRRAALRSLLGGIIMLSASIAVVHAAAARQPTRDDVKGADQVQSDENALAKRIDEENARLDRFLRGICRGC